MSIPISSVLVTLDSTPEYMEGVFRCASVRSFDADEKLLVDHKDLVDNAEFHSLDELRDSVAKRIGVSPEIVQTDYCID